MTRRRVIRGTVALAGLGLLAACDRLPGQAPPKVPRVGHLSNGPVQEAFSEAFGQGLRDHGYVEGQSVLFEARYADGKEERLGDLAAELVRLPVDVIVTLGSPTAEAVRRATETIPIVAISGQQVQTGLVSSLARPSGNLTGLTLTFEGLRGKKMELLKEAVPGVTRLAVLGVANNAAHAVSLKEVQEAAQKLAMEVQFLEMRGPEDFEGIFAAGAAWGANGLFVQDDPSLFVHRARIIELAARDRLPTIYGRREWVDQGGLMVQGVNFPDVFRRAAGYVDKILKGANPADLPIEQPSKFDVVINLKTAQALGLTIPPSVLQQATEIIQ
jgi:putative ABC transport system substrate-binding protein